MKMCSISVAPIPSMMRSPVARSHASNVASGSASPAETHLRSVETFRPPSASTFTANDCHAVYAGHQLSFCGGVFASSFCR